MFNMDTRRILVSLVVSVVIIVRTVITVDTNLKSNFIFEENRQITSNFYRKTVTDSILECAMVCEFSENCYAANYEQETKTCFLSNNICSLTQNAPGWKYIRLTILNRICCLSENESDWELSGLPSFKAQRTFQHVLNQTTWNDAKSYCESIGGDLANIYSQTDHETIRNIISQSQETQAWVGGSDIDSEGDWVWTNGCKFNDQDFNFWKAGNPNNMYQSENCLELVRSEWNDQRCHILRSFVCEVYVA